MVAKNREDLKVPYTPQEPWELLLRYKAAVKPIFTEDATAIGDLPAHVFDFYKGLRLIISRNQLPDGIYVHYSAGVVSGTRMYHLIESGQLGIHGFVKGVERILAVVFSDQGPFVLTITESNIPHWFRKEEQ